MRREPDHDASHSLLGRNLVAHCRWRRSCWRLQGHSRVPLRVQQGARANEPKVGVFRSISWLLSHLAQERRVAWQLHLHAGFVQEKDELHGYKAGPVLRHRSHVYERVLDYLAF